MVTVRLAIGTQPTVNLVYSSIAKKTTEKLRNPQKQTVFLYTYEHSLEIPRVRCVNSRNCPILALINVLNVLYRELEYLRLLKIRFYDLRFFFATAGYEYSVLFSKAVL